MPGIKNHDFSNKLTIIIPSVDTYSELWPVFFNAFFKFWPSVDTTNSIVLISNYKGYSDPRIHNVMVGQDKSWSDSLITALQEVNTQYVLILLEDYILTKEVNVQRLNDVINYMSNSNAAYAEVVVDDGLFKYGYEKNKNLASGIDGVIIRSIDGEYRNSLQACVWNKEDLMQVLEEGWSAWDFEIKGNAKTRDIKKDFLALITEGVFGYINAVDKRSYTIDFLKYIQDNNIPFILDSKKIPAKYKGDFSSIHNNNIDSNQELINYHLKKMVSFIQNSHYSLYESVERFKTYMPQEIWNRDYLLLIKYSKGNVDIMRGKTHEGESYPQLILEQMKTVLSNNNFDLPEFEIIINWRDKSFTPLIIDSLVMAECSASSDNENCKKESIKGYINIYKQTPIFMMSKDTQGEDYRYLEREENVFFLPDLYMFFKNGANQVGHVNCHSLNTKDRINFEDKLEKAFFIGSPTTAKDFDRSNFQNFDPSDPTLNNFVRLKFKAISLKHPEILDSRMINYCDANGERKPWEIGVCEKLFTAGYKMDNPLPFEASLEYKYLISIDGNTAAWCRVPSILKSNSVLVKVGGTSVEWFYPAMKEYVHYIPSPESEEGFLETFEFLKTHNAMMPEIIENAHRFVDTFLTEEAIKEYTYQIFYGYASNYNNVFIEESPANLFSIHQETMT